MSYTPENNPYIPGDPYSYDLKWMVSDIKHMEERFGELDSQVQEATDQADRAQEEADRAVEEANRSRDEADRADDEALVSEGYAKGTQDGEAVTSGSPYFENNSKYYSEESAASAAEAADYAAHIADPVAGLVTSWLEDNVDPDTGYVIDKTLTVSDAAADAKVVGDKIKPMYEDISLYGSIYERSPHYINGTAEAGSYYLSCSFDVRNVKHIEISYTTAQYYDKYDFIDANNNVISFERELNPGSSTTLSLDVPSNAVVVVVNGGDSGNATATATIETYDNKIFDALMPVSVLQAYWNTSDKLVKFQRSYRFYLYDIRNIDRVTIQAVGVQYTKAYVKLNADMSYAGNELVNTAGLYQLPSYIITDNVENVAYIGVSTSSADVPIVTGYGTKSDLKHDTENTNKHFVWYGTSIPAGGYIGKNVTNNYPNFVGQLLDAKIDNEAVGQSCVVCKDPSLISADNPYGFLPDFIQCSRCLTNSLAEMEWIISHYNDANVFLYNVPGTMTTTLADEIRSFSYENALDPYLTITTCPDVFIFDHGHNDVTVMEKREDLYDDTTELTGTDQLGWYLAGAYQSSSSYQSIKFDVSGYDWIELSGDIGAYFDIYDLFDSSNVYLRSLRNGYELRHVDKMLIDVSDASYIIVSAGNLINIATVSVKGFTYGYPDTNVYSFRGAMGFLFGRIFNALPQARVVMIGDYENQKRPAITYYQTWVADHWQIPILKQWDIYGWSQRLITTNWFWNAGGEFVQGGTPHRMTMLQANLADGEHPHSDTTQRANMLMARTIASWLDNEIFNGSAKIQ